MSTLVKRIALFDPVGSPPSAGNPNYYIDVPHVVPRYRIYFYYDSEGNLRAMTLPDGTTVVSTREFHAAVDAVASTLAMSPLDLHDHGWNAGALSISSLLADGVYTFTCNGEVAGIATGLNALDEGSGYAEIDHAFLIAGGYFGVIESGVERIPREAFVPGTTFHIVRDGETVSYWVDDHSYSGLRRVYTSTVPSPGTVSVDASLFMGRDAIIDAELASSIAAAFTDNRGHAHGTIEVIGFGADYDAHVGSGQIPLAGSAGGHAWMASGSGRIPMRGEAYAGLSNTATVKKGSYAGSIELVGTIGIGNRGRGEIALQGEAYAAGVRASGSGRIELTGDGGAGLVIPQYGYADGFIDLAAFGYAHVRAPVSGAGTITLVGFGADYNAHVGGGTIVVEGVGFDHEAFGARAYGILTMPQFSFYGLGNTGTTVGLNEQIPGFRIDGRGGQVHGGGRVPRFSMTASATTTLLATLRESVPRFRMVATAMKATLARLYASVPGLSIEGTTGAVGDNTVPRFELNAHGIQWRLASATLTVPSFAIEGHAVRGIGTLNGGGGIIVLQPMVPAWLRASIPRFQLLTHAYTVAAVVYEGFSMTLREGDAGLQLLTTTVLNCPFEQIVRWRGRYLGATTDGLFEIIGDDFDGDPILAVVETHPDDFDTAALKRPFALHMAGRIETSLTVSVRAGEDGGDFYAGNPTPPQPGGAYNHRAKLPRGLEARYLDYRIENPDGGDFALDETTGENDVLRRTLGGRTRR